MKDKQRKHAFAAGPKTMIYNYIADHGTVSKAELLEAAGLTSSTLTRLLDEMVQTGLLLVSGYGPSNGGRRPLLYEINADYGYFFGLELSRRYSALGFFDMKLNPKSFTRWRMDEAMTPSRLVRHVAGTIRSILNDHRLPAERVFGIGVGAVGPLERSSGTILEPLNFPAPGWTNVPITELLTEATGLPAALENGANAALLGEHWAMREEKLQHMLYVHAGVGLRSAMMSYGRIVHGSVDMEGSIGQMIIQTDGPRLNDTGNYGALEAYVSVQALERQARADAKLGRCGLPNAEHLAPDAITYDMLLGALAHDNSYAEDLFQRSAGYFGIGLANLINVFHPEAIVLGGALIVANESFCRTAIEVARRNTYYYPQYEPSFTKGTLREDAVATGAALLMRNRMEW